MQRSSLFVVATLLVLAACGGNDSDVDASTPASPSSSSSSTPSPATSPTSAASSPPATSSAPDPSQPADPAARRHLRAAQRAVVEADTGTVRTVVVLGPVRTETVAHYELSSRSMQSEITTTTPDERLVTDMIAVGKGVWFRITGREGDEVKQTCWMHSDQATIQDATGVDLSRGKLGFPAGVMVPLLATGLTQVDSERVLGRVDIFSLATAFSGKVPLMLGIDISTKSTAPVVIDVEAGVVTGWRGTLVGLLAAVEDAGLDLGELEGYQDADLAAASVEARLSDPGTPVSVAPPPADQVVELTADQQLFQQEREACEARQG